MFVARCVLPLAMVASLAACDRSDPVGEPPRRPALDTMQDLVAPDVDDSTTGGDEDFVDDFVGLPYDSDDSSYDEDLAWYDSDGEAGEDAYHGEGDGWCEEPDDPVCGYEYGYVD